MLGPRFVVWFVLSVLSNLAIILLRKRHFVLWMSVVRVSSLQCWGLVLIYDHGIFWSY